MRYGVYGLMEFVLHIKVAGGSLEVHFSGGQLSGYGVVPATYSTTDPVMCRLIESSPEFLKGRIKRL